MENKHTIYKTKDTGFTATMLALSDEAKINTDTTSEIYYFRDISLYSVEKAANGDIVFTLTVPRPRYGFHSLLSEYNNFELKVDAKRYRNAHKELTKMVKANY